MSIQVVEKKFPFIDRPTARFIFASAKRAREGRDQIELPPEIRERLERANAMRHPLDAQELDQLVAKRIKIEIQADTAVPKLFGEKKKKSGAATEIENSFRGRTVQLQLARTR